MPPGRYKREGLTKTKSLDATCYYRILGIIKTADEQAIKKAYRSLALKWHPDKNPENKEEAEKKFKEIAEAYEVLSNSTESKRSLYDRWGKEGVKNGPPSPNPPPCAPHTFFNDSDFIFRSPFDVFKEFFGGRDPFQDLLAEHFHADFFGMGSEAMDGFFGGPIMRRNPETLEPYHGGVPGFLSSHFHFDPFSEPKKPKSEGGFCSTISFTSGEPGQAAAVRKTSTTTKFNKDGKKVVTKKTEEGGREIIEVVENGKLKSKTVNKIRKDPPAIITID